MSRTATCPHKHHGTPTTATCGTRRKHSASMDSPEHGIDTAPTSGSRNSSISNKEERSRRSLERRLRNAQLSNFKSLADFDWGWPKKVDRDQVEELMQLRILQDGTNVLLVGPNGVGKTMIAKNLAYAAVLAGKRVRFTSAAKMLNDLGSQPTTRDLERRIRRLRKPGAPDHRRGRVPGLLRRPRRPPLRGRQPSL